MLVVRVEIQFVSFSNETIVNIVKMESDLRAVISEVAKKHGYESLEEQLTVIEKFVAGQDVFVSLPTGSSNVKSSMKNCLR